MAFGAALRRVPAETVARTRIWGTVLATALGVGALAGAGQLGVAYGLGLVRFARVFPTDGLWSTQLTWVAWFAALAGLAGGAAGARAARRFGLVRQLGGRILVAVAGGLGAAIVVPLTARPADGASLLGRETAAPALEVALAAGLGVVVGILATVAALSVRLVAVSLIALVALIWLIALVSVAPALAPTADLPQVRLGVLDLPAAGGPGSAAAVLTPAIVALLVCGGIAGAARYRGLSPLLAAVSSTAAPGLLALVYLIGSPGTGERAVQAAPYAGALLAVAGGLLVSLGIGVIRIARPGRLTATPTASLASLDRSDALGSAGATPADGRLPSPGGPGEALPEPTTPPAAPPDPAWPPEPVPPPVEPPHSPPEPPPEPKPERTPAPAAGPAPEPTPASQPTPAPEPTPASQATPAAPSPRRSRRARKRDRPPEPPPVHRPEPAPGPEPEPVPEREAAAGQPSPPAPDLPAPRSSRRSRRREEQQDQHVGWISSLAGESEPGEPEPRRRRLRRDQADPAG